MPRRCDSGQSYLITNRDQPTAVSLPVADHEAQIETLDLLANHEAMRARRSPGLGACRTRTWISRMRNSAPEQAQPLLRGLPPELKLKMRRQRKALADGKIHGLDVKPLRRELKGFHRLRVGNFRIVDHLPSP